MHQTLITSSNTRYLTFGKWKYTCSSVAGEIQRRDHKSVKAYYETWGKRITRILDLTIWWLNYWRRMICFKLWQLRYKMYIQSMLLPQDVLILTLLRITYVLITFIQFHLKLKKKIYLPVMSQDYTTSALCMFIQILTYSQVFMVNMDIIVT